MEERDLARLLAWSRIGIGAFGALMPSTLARLWIGREQSVFPTNMVARGLAVRDIALGVGILTALDDGERVKPWLLASAAADAGDAVGTLSSWSELGRLRGLGLLALEVGAAVVGFSLADSLD